MHQVKARHQSIHNVGEFDGDSVSKDVPPTKEKCSGEVDDIQGSTGLLTSVLNDSTTNDELPCIFHIDSTQIHHTSQVISLMRRFLSAVYLDDLNESKSKEKKMKKESELDSAQILISNSDINPQIVPGFSVRLCQQV